MARKKKTKVNPLTIIPDSIPVPSLDEEIAGDRRWLKQIIKELYLGEFQPKTIDFFMVRAFERSGYTNPATPENILAQLEGWADYPQEIQEWVAESSANVLICYDDDEVEGVDKNELIRDRFAGTLKVHLQNVKQKTYKDLRAMAIAHFAQ